MAETETRHTMRTRIKVCCIASVEEARTAIAAGADALGLVGDMPSGPGVIGDARAIPIAAIVPPPVATFLLTQEGTGAAIADHLRRVGAGVVQVVRHIEPPEHDRLAELLPHARRVQVVHVEDRSALDLIAAYAPFVHAFLLDSGTPSASVPELGGTGRVHDWAISAEFVRRSPHPVFLAGGLTAANVRNAIHEVRPYGLDLCSGLRTENRLDPEKLTAFVQAVREADRVLTG